jgi:hypothetical protein
VSATPQVRAWQRSWAASPPIGLPRWSPEHASASSGCKQAGTRRLQAGTPCAFLCHLQAREARTPSAPSGSSVASCPCLTPRATTPLRPSRGVTLILY